MRTRPSNCGEGELRELVQALFRRFGVLQAEATPCGQPLAPSHAHALMLLLAADRLGSRPTQSELAAGLGIDKSNVARLCAKLESAGMIRQQEDLRDRRRRTLRLTARGRRSAARVEAASQERFARLAEAMPARELRRVTAALATLNDAIERTRDFSQNGDER